MKNTASNRRKTMSLSQAKRVLQGEAVASGLKREDELDGDFSTEVEFLLSLRGRRLLCHMKKEYPYTIRFRLIGERDYEKSKPEDFVTLAKTKLLH